jgi:hypothetical protein
MVTVGCQCYFVNAGIVTFSSAINPSFRDVMLANCLKESTSPGDSFFIFSICTPKQPSVQAANWLVGINYQLYTIRNITELITMPLLSPSLAPDGAEDYQISSCVHLDDISDGNEVPAASAIQQMVNIDRLAERYLRDIEQQLEEIRVLEAEIAMLEP